MSLFDSLRLERAAALACSPHLLQVQVVVGAGEDVNLEEEEGVRLTGLTLTSASLTSEGKVLPGEEFQYFIVIKVGEAEERHYSVSLPPLLVFFHLNEVMHTMICWLHLKRRSSSFKACELVGSIASLPIYMTLECLACTREDAANGCRFPSFF